MANGKRKDPLIWGLILIGIGAIFLLHNLDYDVWDYVGRLWPVILIVWGGWKLYFGLKANKDNPDAP
ncbi:LiaI-LiaF-like domain-containing protein [Acidobacteriota bacterium]